MRLAREKTAATAVSWVLGVGLASSNGAIFLVNDSPLMKAYVSGEYTGEPDPNLVFSSRLLALPMARLYELIPSVSWYSSLLLVTTLLCVSAVLISTRTLTELLSWSIFLTPISAFAAIRPDYTFTAVVGVAMATTSSLFFLRNDGSKANRLCTYTSLIFILLALSWRPSAGLLALAVMGPAFITISLLTRKILFVGCPLLVGIVGYLASVVLDFINTTSWLAWLEYNALRGTLHSEKLQVASNYASVAGWTEAQFTAFSTFSYPDEATFMITGIQDLASAIPRVTSLPSDSLFGIAQVGIADVFSYWPLWAIAVSVFLIPRIQTFRTLHTIAVVSMSSFAYWSLLLLVIRYIRLPEQLHLPLVITMLISLAVSVSDWGTPYRPDVPFTFVAASCWTVVAAFSVFSSLTLPPFNLVDSYQRGDQLTSETRLFFKSLKLNKDCDAFLASPYLARFAMTNPYGRNPYWDAPILELGWGTMSPPWVQRREALGFGSNVLGALRTTTAHVDKYPNFCFIGDENEAQVYRSLLSDFGYGYTVNIVVSRFDIAGDPPPIWRFYEMKPPQSLN